MKRVIKIVTIGICVGFVLAIFQKSFRIDKTAFMRGYWIAATAIIIGAVLINVFYNLVYLNKMRKIAKLLREQKPQEYIDGIEALLKTAKGENLRNILTLNLAAGYVEIKQFDMAITMLEGLSAKHLKGSAVNAAHRLNLCISYFETGQHEKAMALYDGSQTLFKKYRDGNIYGANIALLDILAAIGNKQYERAEKLLDSANKTYDDAWFQKVFHEVAHTLNEMKDSQHE